MIVGSLQGFNNQIHLYIVFFSLIFAKHFKYRLPLKWKVIEWRQLFTQRKVKGTILLLYVQSVITYRWPVLSFYFFNIIIIMLNYCIYYLFLYTHMQQIIWMSVQQFNMFILQFKIITNVLHSHLWQLKRFYKINCSTRTTRCVELRHLKSTHNII